MSERKRKTLYWLFKILSIVISCALPIWAICEKYPLWKTAYGTTHSIGVDGILVLIALRIIFRKSFFGFISVAIIKNL